MHSKSGKKPKRMIQMAIQNQPCNGAFLIVVPKGEGLKLLNYEVNYIWALLIKLTSIRMKKIYSQIYRQFFKKPSRFEVECSYDQHLFLIIVGAMPIAAKIIFSLQQLAHVKVHKLFLKKSKANALICIYYKEYECFMLWPIRISNDTFRNRQ